MSVIICHPNWAVDFQGKFMSFVARSTISFEKKFYLESIEYGFYGFPKRRCFSEIDREEESYTQRILDDSVHSFNVIIFISFISVSKL